MALQAMINARAETIADSSLKRKTNFRGLDYITSSDGPQQLGNYLVQNNFGLEDIYLKGIFPEFTKNYIYLGEIAEIYTSMLLRKGITEKKLLGTGRIYCKSKSFDSSSKSML